MKIIIPILLLFVTFVISGVLIVSKLDNLFIPQAMAREQSPLDFISEYNDFAITIGINKQAGRYISYHYEFKE